MTFAVERPYKDHTGHILFSRYIINFGLLSPFTKSLSKTRRMMGHTSDKAQAASKLSHAFKPTTWFKAKEVQKPPKPKVRMIPEIRWIAGSR